MMFHHRNAHEDAGQTLFQLIAAPLLELLKEVRCPRGFAHLVGIIKECMRVRCAGTLKCLFYVFQVVGYGLLVEVVDNQSLATRRSAFHLHDAKACIDGYDVPSRLFGGTLRRSPRQ